MGAYQDFGLVIDATATSADGKAMEMRNDKPRSVHSHPRLRLEYSGCLLLLQHGKSRDILSAEPIHHAAEGGVT